MIPSRLPASAAGLLALVVSCTSPADEWPQWRGPNRDGVWRETGIIDSFDGEKVALRWRVPLAGGYSGPTVADGRVYVTDRITKPKSQERIHCFAWETGETVWTYAYDCEYKRLSYPTGPRASVITDEGRTFALGAMGHLHCLDGKTGKVLWSKDPKADLNVKLPTWGIAAAPLVEGELLIAQVGAKSGGCLIAFDKATGKERWRALDDPASYAAPIIVEQAGRRVLVSLTGTRVVGLDPATGKLHWESPLPPKEPWAAGIMTPAWHKDKLFISTFSEGSLMLRLRADAPATDEVWRRAGPDEHHTDALHILMSVAIVDDTHLYGFDAYGMFRCLDAATGDRVWETAEVVPEARWATAHMVRNGDKVWLFNEKGELIIAKLSPKGYEEISRAKLIKPTLGQLPGKKRGGACWTHPAFAYKHVFVRNDEELVCASLAAK